MEARNKKYMNYKYLIAIFDGKNTFSYYHDTFSTKKEARNIAIELSKNDGKVRAEKQSWFELYENGLKTEWSY